MRKEKKSVALKPYDADGVPSPVFAISTESVGKDWESRKHQHRKAQLFYTVRGVVNCEVDDGVWIVPPQCAVWIPGHLPHSVRGSGETECYCLFVEPDAATHMPAACCTVAVSPLLRELIVATATFPQVYPPGGREARLVATLLDELFAAPAEDLHLPWPRDARLRQLVEMLLAAPADKTPIGEWASRIAMSERSMSRLLLQEVGMSFGRWRRQLHVILSLQRLSKGESVQTVALELGYDSVSGFITMFRKAVGKPPARYLADRAQTSGNNEVPAVAGIRLPDHR